jgi:hypothetical protein
MKININTPDFCPDECPYAEIEVERLYTDIDKCYTSKYKCSREPLCQNLYDFIKNKIIGADKDDNKSQ